MAGKHNPEQDNGAIYKLRHSTAHVMAEAVLDRFPEAHIAIGPPIKDGFYYDFDLGRNPDGSLKTFAPEDLEAIEKRMRQIAAGKFPFIRQEISAADAKKLFAGPTVQDRVDRGVGAGWRG